MNSYDLIESTLIYDDKHTDHMARLIDIDELAELLLNPDQNFDQLVEVWNTKREFIPQVSMNFIWQEAGGNFAGLPPRQ